MHERRRATGALLLLALLAACGAAEVPPAEGQLRLRFEDRAEPGAFLHTGTAVRDRPEGAAGLWVAVRGLPRPERGLVENAGNGRSVVAALFAAPRGAPDIRLSNDAADALGIADAATVTITALRSAPRIDTTTSRSSRFRPARPPR